MKIGRVTAAPTLIAAGGGYALISPPSLRDYGLLFRCLARSLPRPAEAPAEWVPPLGDPEAIAFLLDPARGLGLLLFVGMRRDHPGQTLEQAMARAATLDEDDREELFRLVLHRPGLPDAVALEHWKPDGGPGGLDAVDLGALVERPEVRGFAPDVVANWTLDQLENKLAGGRLGDAAGVPLSAGEAARFFARMNDPEARDEARRLREAQEADDVDHAGADDGPGGFPAREPSRNGGRDDPAGEKTP